MRSTRSSPTKTMCRLTRSRGRPSSICSRPCVGPSPTASCRLWVSLWFCWSYPVCSINSPTRFHPARPWAAAAIWCVIVAVFLELYFGLAGMILIRPRPGCSALVLPRRALLVAGARSGRLFKSHPIETPGRRHADLAVLIIRRRRLNWSCATTPGRTLRWQPSRKPWSCRTSRCLARPQRLGAGPLNHTGTPRSAWLDTTPARSTHPGPPAAGRWPVSTSAVRAARAAKSVPAPRTRG